MIRFRWTWMSLLVLMVLCGCRTTREREEWEARYRDQRDEIASLQNEVSQLNRKLTLREQEGDDLRLQLASVGKVALSPEQAQLLYSATGIRINKLLSGGVDRDGIPGDDGLSILMTPHDEDGSLVKLPGEVEISLMDMTLPKGQETIGRWTIAAEDVKQQWHAGLVGAGYLFEVNWQSMPHNRNLLMHVRMKTGDGRQFDVSEQFTVTLPVNEIQPVRSDVVPIPADSSTPFTEQPVPVPSDQLGVSPEPAPPFEQESSIDQNEPETFPIAPEEVTSDSWKKTESPSRWK